MKKKPLEMIDILKIKLKENKLESNFQFEKLLIGLMNLDPNSEKI